MEGLKFEYKGKFYEVPHFPDEEDAYWMLSEGRCPKHGWCSKACYNSLGIYGGCVYGQYNAEARKAFYNQCFRAEKSEEAEEKPCEECANPYKVLSATSLLVLERQVNEYLQRGWVLQGGVVKDGDIYMQAMIKK